MRLLTADLRRKLPRLGATANTQDPCVICKFFDPCGAFTWYVIEFDGDDTFFGLVQGQEEELGYFSLAELQSVKNWLGLGIERDLYFDPKPLSHFRQKAA